MKIEKIKIHNFRAIKDIEFDFNKKINVFVGVNGAGKSTTLDGLAISLSWLINRIQRPNISGRHIPELSIRTDEEKSSIKISVNNDDEIFSWKLVKTKKGASSSNKSNLMDASKLANYYREYTDIDNSLPVIVYYPVDRNVDTISPDIKGKDSIYILDVYENALGGSANFQSFFEWFRLQDDIVNEQSQSRTKWMRQNSSLTKKRVKRLIELLEKNSTQDFLDSPSKLRFLYFLEQDFFHDDPRHLFNELIKLTERTHFKTNTPLLRSLLQDIEYFFHRLSITSNAMSEDQIKDHEQIPFHFLGKIIEKFPMLYEKKELQLNLISFIWETLLLSILLSFWWISDKGKREIENIFKELHPTKHENIKQYEWHINTKEIIDDLNIILKKEFGRIEKASVHKGRELQFAIKAIEQFIPDYKNLRITRTPNLQMLIDKKGITLRLDQLSDGEKNLIALIGDIARRLSIANSYEKNPLHGNGIIIIDEIDLHLHPSWQRMIISRLIKVFPNCQFIVSTHSPQILGHVKPENIFLLKYSKSGISYSKPTQSYGINTDRLLEDLMEVDARPKNIKTELQKLFEIIQENKLELAKEKIEELQILMNGNIAELVKANVLIKRKESIGK